jgi:hypothetical protein
MRSKDNAADTVQQQRAKAHEARLERCVTSHLAAEMPQFHRDSSKGFGFGVAPRMIDGNQDRAGAFGDD